MISFKTFRMSNCILQHSCDYVMLYQIAITYIIQHIDNINTELKKYLLIYSSIFSAGDFTHWSISKLLLEN